MQPPRQTASPPKLLDRVRDAIRARHYSRRTEVAYVTWMCRYIGFHQKVHPSTLGAADISAFSTWLATKRHVSASTQNQALAALLFLYERVLQMPIGQVEHVIRAKQPLRLPVVLSRQEVVSVLAHVQRIMWIIGMLLYVRGCAWRNVWSCESKILISIETRSPFGAAKDRITMLPSAAIDPLRKHLEDVRRLHASDLQHRFGRVGAPMFSICSENHQIGRSSQPVTDLLAPSSAWQVVRVAERVAIMVPARWWRGAAGPETLGSARGLLGG